MIRFAAIVAVCFAADVSLAQSLSPEQAIELSARTGKPIFAMAGNAT